MGRFGVVRGHPRSSETSPFDRAHTTSYLTLIETASILYHFRDTASYLSKFADFTYPTSIWRPRWGVTPFEFLKDFWHQKTRVPGLSCGVVCMILRVAVLIQYRLVTDRRTDGQTDRQTDRQTHGHTTTANTALA